MVRRFSRGSTMGLAAILGIGGCTLLLAQEPAAGRAGANAPRPTPAVLVMKVEFKAAVAGKTEQLPFVQANVVDPNLELKQVRRRQGGVDERRKPGAVHSVQRVDGHDSRAFRADVP